MMIPELPELPEIKQHSVNAIRLRGTLAAALPGMPYLGTEQLTGYNAREVERRKMQEAMRIAYEITRRQNAIAAARASYLDRLAQYAVERRRGWYR